MVAEIAFDPTNHHNALKCPYCNPQGLSFATTPADTQAMREALDRVGIFFRLLRGSSSSVDGYALAITKREYDDAREAYDTLRAALAATGSHGRGPATISTGE